MYGRSTLDSSGCRRERLHLWLAAFGLAVHHGSLAPSLMCSDRHMAVSNQLAAGAIAIGTLAPDDVGIVARHRRYRAAGDTVIEWLSGDLNQSGCRL
jgi:hypothetical protein